MKVIRHFFATLLVITTFISLLLLTLIGSSQLLLSKQNIVELVKQVDFRELIGYQIEDDIYQLLEQAGLPNQYVDYMIKDEKFKEYIGNYMAKDMESLLYRKEQIAIDSDELSSIFVNSMNQASILFAEDMVEGDESLTEQDQQRIRQKLTYYVPKIAEKIPTFENLLEMKVGEMTKNKELKQIRLTIQILQNCYKWKPFLSICILIQLGLIFVLKIRKFKYMKWVTIPFLMTGIALFYLKSQLPLLIKHYFPRNLSFMKAFFEQTMHTIYISWNQTILICFSLSILFVILQFLIRFAHMQQKDS